MSNLVLALNLMGPMQSWGTTSRFNRRETDLMPTRSAIAGLCCAAKGIPRGQEADFLRDFSNLKLDAFAIPRQRPMRDGFASDASPDLRLCKYQDFHTVLGTVTAEGKSNSNAVVTYRQYLTDISFVVFLEGGEDFIREIAVAIQDPVWGVWLGRKSCIPSEPVFAGVYASRSEALDALVKDRWTMRQEEVEDFSLANWRRDDVPLCFHSQRRLFSSRFVRMYSR